jgi:hypothetical protein
VQDKQKCVEILSIVARGMKDLKNEIVFIGGVTTFVYMDSPVALEVRPTDDVDCTIEITSVYGYEELQQRLLSLNFRHDATKGSPVCRWTYKGIKVDLMPTGNMRKGLSRKTNKTLIFIGQDFLFQNS